MDDAAAVEAFSWRLIIGAALAAATWMGIAGFSLDAQGAIRPLLASLVLGALVWFYRTRRVDLRLAATLTGVLQLVLGAAAVAPLSYLAASLAGPLWDDAFLAWDLALGLDWRAYLSWANERPWLALSLSLAYRTLIPQTLIAGLVLGLTGRLHALRTFVAAFVVSGLICTAVAGVMPAVSMFANVEVGPVDYRNLAPAADFVAEVARLRDGTLRTIALSSMEGIITFPSYHATLAVLFIAAFWSVPGLRWPACLLNLAVIAATPIDGGHYFIDVIAGVGVAALALAIVRAVALGPARRATDPSQGAVPVPQPG